MVLMVAVATQATLKICLLIYYYPYYYYYRQWRSRKGMQGNAVPPKYFWGELHSPK